MLSCRNLGRGINQCRWNAVAFCLAGLFLSAVFAGRLAAQSNEAASSGVQQPQPSEQPQAAQPSQAPADPQSAQPAEPHAQPAAPHAVRRRALIDERVKALAASLNLTEQQQAAVKRILEQRQAETLRLRNAPMSGSERIDRLHLLQDQTIEKIRSVLNDEQKKKYDPLAVRKVPPSADQKSVEDWLKVTTPH